MSAEDHIAAFLALGFDCGSAEPTGKGKFATRIVDNHGRAHHVSVQAKSSWEAFSTAARELFG